MPRSRSFCEPHVILGRVALRPGCCVALLPARPVDLRCPGCSVVEYPGKVACPSGRRCSTRNAVWCHSHPGFKSQRYRHCRPAPLGPGGFVMPRWRVCVGCLWRRWCSGRRLCVWTGLRRGRRPAREPSALRASLGVSARCLVMRWVAACGLVLAVNHEFRMQFP